MIKVSIICPTFNEEKYIGYCIESIITQDYSLEDLELLLVDGQSTDKTRTIIVDYSKIYNFIKLLDNPYKMVSRALNIGICEARGNIIIRIDGHCVYPPNYISSLIKYLYELNADNVGGIWDTLPANDSIACCAIAIASSHKFGVGSSKHKVGTKSIIETDTVPFGCFRREIFDRIGLFDEELIRNQDDEFNARIIKNGGKIFLIPDLVINYVARDSIYKMSKMYYQYGLFKPLVNKKIGKPTTLRQFFPVLFLCGLMIGGVLSFTSKFFFSLYISVILVYLLIGIIIGINNIHKSIRLIYYLPFIFLTIHISYGYGYLVGLYKVITKSKFQAIVNR